MAKLSTIQVSGTGTYVQVTDHASAPSPTANKLYANTSSLYWEDTDLAAGGGDAMDKVKSQGPTTSGAATTTGLANTAVLMASGANTAINVLFDQGTTLAGAYNASIHVAGDVNMPGLAITSDGTNGSQTINDLSATDHTITATADVHHDSGGSISLRMAGNGFGSGTDTAYNDTAIHFDGSADDLVIADHEDWNFGFDDFTIEGWAYRTSDTTQQVLFGGSGGTAATFYAIRMEGGGFNLMPGWAGSEVAGASIPWTINKWVHWAMVGTETHIYFYVDGKLGYTSGTRQNIDLGAWEIGHSPNIPGGWGNANYIGYMDNIHIYPYAKYTEEFSQQLPILARAITSNRAGEFTVRGNALWAGVGDDISLADTGFVNRTGEDTTGDGLVSVVIDSPQTVNSTAFMVPVIFKNTSDVPLTLNYNMWASVRANTAAGSAASSRMTYYGNRGVWAGGGPSNSDVIDYFTIDTVSETALDFGNLSAARRAMASASTGTRALFAAGYTTTNINIIEYITVASTGNATDFGDTSTLRRYPAGASDGNRAVFMGGENPTTIVDTMDFITMSVSGNATDFGENTQARSTPAATSNGSRACYIAGESPTKRDTIDYITIGTIGDATDFGEITLARAGLTGLSDGSRGIVAGGSTGSVTDVIDYFNMASLGNGADYGNLATGTNGVAGSSNGSRGVVGMGATPGGGTHVDTVNYFPIGTLTATATDFGELSVARSFGAATSGD